MATTYQSDMTADARALDSVFGRASTGLLVAELDGAITSINAAMEQLLGMAPGCGLGANLLALLDPPDQICDVLETLLGSGASPERVITIDDGKGRRPIALSAALLPSPGRVDRQEFLATGRPVEGDGRQDSSDDATVIAASARLGSLVAHDLNNVLSVILGACHMLDSAIDDDATRHDLESLVAASTEAALIVRQLATFGDPRPSALVLIKPDAELRQLAPVLSRLIASDIDLDLTAVTAGGALLSDPAVFHDVIISLALEARRTMGARDHVTLQIAPSPTGDEWRLCLWTYTPAMNDMDQYTDPSADSNTSRPSRIGRLAVQRWVEAQGGRLEVGTDASGFAAEVTWPRVDDGCTPRVNNPAPEAAPQAKAVLVVDDNLRLRQFVERVLTGNGYEVVAVGNDRSALEAIHSRRFDAVVTDIGMPDMSGWEVGQAVGLNDSACGMLFVSRASVDGEGVEARGGNRLVLLKPFTTARLLECVALACSRRMPS